LGPAFLFFAIADPAGWDHRFWCKRRARSPASPSAAVVAILTDAFCGLSRYLCCVGHARVFRCMAVTDFNALPCASRLTAVPIALLAIALTFPLGGCSFDLGSWGSDKEKPQAAEQRPTGTIGGQSASDAQGYATRGQALAKSGKTDEALAEFDRALALDPYNVPALYGRGLIYQADKQHGQAIADFTAA